jgi:hypothetical protein
MNDAPNRKGIALSEASMLLQRTPSASLSFGRLRASPVKQNFFLLALLARLLTGCGSPQWEIDRATPPRAWTTHPVAKSFGRLHAYYELHPSGTVTAHVRPASFPLPFHIETGSSSNDIGDYGNWVRDITFHGVTERYWGHYAYAPTWRAVLTVVPRDYKPNPANTPGARGTMYPCPVKPPKSSSQQRQ